MLGVYIEKAQNPPHLALSLTHLPKNTVFIYLNSHLSKHSSASFTISEWAKLGLVQTTQLSRKTRSCIL